eukprot:symbB.v1.2.009345.t1/scaffold561.1/size520142/13
MVRLWCVSDIHTDIKEGCSDEAQKPFKEVENLLWVKKLSDTEFLNDVLIVAGDVSDSLPTLELTLSILKQKYAEVFFVPGNHDLWTDDDSGDSVQKLHQMMTLCQRLKIQTSAKRIGTEKEGCWVCPILSFHHQSWDPEPDLQGWDLPADPAQCMVDFDRCRFPPGVSMFDASAARKVDTLNLCYNKNGALQPITFAWQVFGNVHSTRRAPFNLAAGSQPHLDREIYTNQAPDDLAQLTDMKVDGTEKCSFNCSRNCHTPLFLIDAGTGIIDRKGYKYALACGTKFVHIVEVPKVAMVFTIKVALSDLTTLSFNAITGECKATLMVEEPQKMLFRDVRKEVLGDLNLAAHCVAKYILEDGLISRPKGFCSK